MSAVRRRFDRDRRCLLTRKSPSVSELTVSVDKDAEEEKLMDASGGEVISVQEEAARHRKP